MAACPVCHSQIEITSQHYGTLYNCSRCNAVFFVDWGGQPETAPAEEEPLVPIVGESYTPPVNEFENRAYADQNEYSSSPESVNYSENEQPSHEASEADAAYVTEPVAAYTTNDQVPEEDYNFDRSLGQIPDPTEPVGGPSDDRSAFADIVDFGNADVTQAAFNYTVTIAGIDTSAIYGEVKDALNDAKFGWNITQIMSQAKDGVLTIKSVNAVKASILIQRIKYLPVKVSWRQDVLSSVQ